jgi:hypothetical protein
VTACAAVRRALRRWLEAFGFKEGSKFAAVGAEGLLVLTVYDGAPNGPSSRDASRAIDAQDDALLPRNLA